MDAQTYFCSGCEKIKRDRECDLHNNVYMSNPFILNALHQFTDTERTELLAIVNETPEQKFIRRDRIISVAGINPSKFQFLGEDAENLHGERIKWAEANVSSWEDYIEENLTKEIPTWLYKYVSFNDIMRDLQNNDEIMILEWDSTKLCWDWAVLNAAPQDYTYNIENIRIISNFN